MVTHADHPVAAIGNFDGVHRGHKALLQRVAALAQRHGAPSAAVVFEPHPRRYFRPGEPPFLLTTSEDRDALIRAAGIDRVIRLGFDAALAAMSPEAFAGEVLRVRLGLGGVVTGSDFRFGAGRAGDSAALARLCHDHGMIHEAIDPAPEGLNGDKVGSSGIRQAIAAGDVAQAARDLGRSWRVSGIVETGRQLGRTLNFPTANIDLGELIRPRFGVYAVRVRHPGGVVGGAANFGRRPTVDNGVPRLEVHLLDFSADLYGERLDVDFIDFIRGEVRFESLDALRAQIAKDCETAKGMLAR